jgi:hypothetical protein
MRESGMNNVEEGRGANLQVDGTVSTCKNENVQGNK